MAETEAEKETRMEEQKFFDELKKNGKKIMNEETEELEFSFDMKAYFEKPEQAGITPKRKKELLGMADGKSPSELRPIHYAAIFDDLKTLDYLFESSVDVTKKNALGSTALHLACCAGAIDVIPNLVSWCQNHEQTNSIGNGLLHCAMLSGSVATVEVLVKELEATKTTFDLQAECHKPNNCSQTPGMMANGAEDLENFLQSKEISVD